MGIAEENVLIILFWDIDGTLLTTGRAGVPAWEAAVKEVTGRDFQLSSIRVPGLTDFQIAVRTFEILGIEATDETLRRMVRLYEEGLPAALPLKQGRVLPNVREILERLHRPPPPGFGEARRSASREGGRDDVRSYLLTGNTRGGAQAKLMHYGLFDYFLDGAFAEDARDRSTIAWRAIELARRAGPVAGDGVFVIGDTPHDIDCAHAIGARTIAVATGGYTLDELAAHRPWRVFAELPSPDEFLRLIGIRDPGPGIRSGRSDPADPGSRIPDPGITA
ncbi:MAG TPA: haloacid dehalogenase-like hydrolase [Vicinamibacterales bacterium]